MMDFWNRIMISALVIVGIWNAAGPGMALSRFGDWLSAKHPYVGKPICLCLPCMASLHGTWLNFVLGGSMSELPVFILALSGLLVIVTRRLLSDS
jgi:hypothetical protein